MVERFIDIEKVAGSIPASRTISLVRLVHFWVRSSVVERCPDKTEVEGSIPSAPTQINGFSERNL